MWMLVNANGYTMNSHRTKFSAVVIHQGKIVAVGETSELKLQYGARVERIVDVAGATVLPGLVDSHLHLAWLGRQMNQLDLARATSASELLARVREYAAGLPGGAFVLGANWDENHFVTPEMPTIAELNEVSGGRPVLLRRVCGHVVVGNHLAYERAGLGLHPADLSDGYFGRDAAGQIDGYAYEGATARLEQGIPVPSRSDMQASIAAAMRAALASGITAVHSEDVRHVGGLYETMAMYQTLQRQGMRLRVHELVGYDFLEEYGQWLDEQKNLPMGERSYADWQETGAVKLFADGSLGGRTAFLLAPYDDAPDTRGTSIYAEEELIERVSQVRKHALPVAIHAIGDAALERVLVALESVAAVERRDRIIHAEVVNETLIRRLAKFGDKLIVDAQPRFAASDLPWAADRLGQERVRYVCAWKSMMGAGLRLCGGSDAPVEPIAPLLGIHAAITRQLPGMPAAFAWSEESLTPLEAIGLFTHGPSFAVHQEHSKGVIQPGWLADLTVVDTDITKPEHVQDIPKTQVLQTIVGGDVAYDAG